MADLKSTEAIKNDRSMPDTNNGLIDSVYYKLYNRHHK